MNLFLLEQMASSDDSEHPLTKQSVQHYNKNEKYCTEHEDKVKKIVKLLETSTKPRILEEKCIEKEKVSTNYAKEDLAQTMIDLESSAKTLKKTRNMKLDMAYDSILKKSHEKKSNFSDTKKINDQNSVKNRSVDFKLDEFEVFEFLGDQPFDSLESG